MMRTMWIGAMLGGAALAAPMAAEPVMRAAAVGVDSPDSPAEAGAEGPRGGRPEGEPPHGPPPGDEHGCGHEGPGRGHAHHAEGQHGPHGPPEGHDRGRGHGHGRGHGRHE